MAIVPISQGKRTPPVAPPRTRPTSSASNSDYQVGYRKPPKHSQFKKGQSGNPKGRPRSAKGLQTIVREVMLEKVLIRTASGEKRVSRAEALVLKNLELATKGNGRALEKLLQLFQAAVPDEAPAAEQQQVTESTAADQAILDALVDDIRERVNAAAGGEG